MRFSVSTQLIVIQVRCMPVYVLKFRHFVVGFSLKSADPEWCSVSPPLKFIYGYPGSAVHNPPCSKVHNFRPDVAFMILSLFRSPMLDFCMPVKLDVLLLVWSVFFLLFLVKHIMHRFMKFQTLSTFSFSRRWWRCHQALSPLSLLHYCIAVFPNQHTNRNAFSTSFCSSSSSLSRVRVQAWITLMCCGHTQNYTETILWFISWCPLLHLAKLFILIQLFICSFQMLSVDQLFIMIQLYICSFLMLSVDYHCLFSSELLLSSAFLIGVVYPH